MWIMAKRQSAPALRQSSRRVITRRKLLSVVHGPAGDEHGLPQRGVRELSHSFASGHLAFTYRQFGLPPCSREAQKVTAAYDLASVAKPQAAVYRSRQRG